MNQTKLFKNTLAVFFAILALLSLGLFAVGAIALNTLFANVATIGEAVPDTAAPLAELEAYLNYIKALLPLVIFGGIAAAFILAGIALRLVIPAVPDRPEDKETVEIQKDAPAEPPVKEPTAVSLLSTLQREGRFIDFLQEDLDSYEDSQIGAAVRTIHQGCKKALNDAAVLEPVVSAAEGAEYVVQEGFDPASIKLVGNVTGNPPFKGILQHHGWRLKRIDLPPVTVKQDEAIIVPAEVEIG